MNEKKVKVIGPNREIHEGIFVKKNGGLVTIQKSENEYITGIPVEGKK